MSDELGFFYYWSYLMTLELSSTEPFSEYDNLELHQNTIDNSEAHWKSGAITIKQLLSYKCWKQSRLVDTKHD